MMTLYILQVLANCVAVRAKLTVFANKFLLSVELSLSPTWLCSPITKSCLSFLTPLYIMSFFKKSLFDAFWWDSPTPLYFKN